MTWALCRRRTGEAVLRAEKVGDLMTADHGVLSEEGESRNNHRYAVVVQDPATQYVQSFPCRAKTLHVTEKEFVDVFEPDRKPEVVYTDTSLEFGKACEDLSWNHRTSTPHRLRQNGIAESLSTSKRRFSSSIATNNQVRMKDGGLILWNAMLSAKCP